jgi:hypothetical protein
MPADFAPQLLHTAKDVRWRGRVDGGVELEVGFSLKAHPDAEEKTRLAVWHVQHLAKAGRHEHLANARKDRHSRRPKPKAPPSLPPAPPKTVAVEQ